VDAGSIELVVARTDPGARRSFAIARAAAHVVLDLLAVAAAEDPTLAYRYSCRSGFCGTCTVLLDGRPVLACQTRVPDGPRADVAPLGGFGVVRDLVVDPGLFADRWAAVEPDVTPDAGAVAGDAPAPAPPPSAAAARSLDCISCGACVAACDLTALDRTFLGPAALTRAMVAIADPRDTRREHRLALVAGRDGVDGCHGIGACSLACPRELDPARAIRQLRRWRMAGPPESAA
jgi:succinate dehydrogenase/fumarate reductase iron-sulfur protein